MLGAAHLHGALSKTDVRSAVIVIRPSFRVRLPRKCLFTVYFTGLRQTLKAIEQVVHSVLPHARNTGDHSPAPHAAFNNTAGKMLELTYKFKIIEKKVLRDHGKISVLRIQLFTPAFQWMPLSYFQTGYPCEKRFECRLHSN